MSNSVSIRDLSLSFGAVNVLQNLDLDIRDGEFLVLLGSSGCGKSTLLNCIAGLLEPTDGQIFIKDRNVTWEEPKDRGTDATYPGAALGMIVCPFSAGTNAAPRIGPKQNPSPNAAPISAIPFARFSGPVMSAM